MNLNWTRIATSGMLCLLPCLALSQDRTKPAPPEDAWDGTNFAVAHSACVRSDCQSFDPSAHAAMTPQGAQCSNELNHAIYRQDILNFMESKAHFDNCAFDESGVYIEALVKEAFNHLALARAQGGDEKLSSESSNAMRALGQALHGIQDFYAHSNYVELAQLRNPASQDQTDIPVLEVWTPAGRAELKRLVDSGLVSGSVWYSFPPHQCRAGGPTHSELAKDSPSHHPAGKKDSIYKNKLTNKPISNHIVALNLASNATRQFLFWAGQQSPKMQTICGATLKYVVQADRRSE
jgi:hypothetical protein